MSKGKGELVLALRGRGGVNPRSKCPNFQDGVPTGIGENCNLYYLTSMTCRKCWGPFSGGLLCFPVMPTVAATVCSNSPGLLLLQLPRVCVFPVRPDGQLMARCRIIQQGCYIGPQVQIRVQTQPPATKGPRTRNCLSTKLLDIGYDLHAPAVCHRYKSQQV
jgi:hypothetical protein